MRFWAVFLFLFPLLLGAISQPLLTLDTKLKKSYTELLEKAADFHKVIEGQPDRKRLEKEIQETQEIIARIYTQLSSVVEFHHKIHSYKLLKSIEEQLTLLQNSSLNKTAEIRNRKRFFNSFFELAQVYNLKKDMKNKLFYCPKDKSLWFQESGKAKNPINPQYKYCGRQLLL